MMILALLWGIGFGFIITTSLIFYEASRIAARSLPEWRVHPHITATCAVLLLFACHLISIGAYAVAYAIVQNMVPAAGALISPEAFPGEYDGRFATILYFSAATYTSLGYGDIVPHGELRILAALEGLNGLVLIGWSASFGYLLMREFWQLHPGTVHKKKARD